MVCLTRALGSRGACKALAFGLGWFDSNVGHDEKGEETQGSDGTLLAPDWTGTGLLSRTEGVRVPSTARHELQALLAKLPALTRRNRVRFPGGSRWEISMKCSACGGPFHPATGHYHQEDVAICGPCIRHFLDWLKGHTAQRRRGFDFYAAAATSIKPDARG